MTVSVLLSATPELLSRVDSLIEVLASLNGVEKVRSVKVRPEDGQHNERVSTSKKQKTTTATAPVAPVEEAVETATQETTTEEAPKFTLEQVRAAAQAKAQSGKREEVRALVTEFGAANLPSLDPSKFNDFMSKLEAL